MDTECNAKQLHSANATSKQDAIIAQKLRVRKLERQFAVEDSCELEQRLKLALKMTGNDEALTSIVTWLTILLPIGAHPTFVLQAWTGWQYRKSSIPVASREMP